MNEERKSWSLYKAAHKVDWRKVGRFLCYPDAYDEDAFRKELHEWMRSLKFYDERLSPERVRLKTLALFNYLWEANGEILSKAKSLPKDSNTNSNSGFFSILPLLYFETSEWRVEPLFWGEDGKLADGLATLDGDYADHEMDINVGSCLSSCGKSGCDITDEKYRYVFSHLQKKHWAGKYERRPAPVLGLSFLAQGCDDAMKALGESPFKYHELIHVFNHGVNGEGFLYGHQFPYSDWTARYMMFILAQRLYVRKDVEDPESSRERFVFAHLYLRFYRKGPDGVLGRESLSREWKDIRWEEKEEEAARCRRVIIEQHSYQPDCE